ncbi:MAG: xanthine dehydrogenase family protein molybdopterin-binding subunit, partial [Sphingobacteriaceae bacterium]
MTENSTIKTAIGQPISRVEAKEKVTGSAKYAAEYVFKDISYGVVITSTITKGRILKIDSKSAEKLPGVLSVISHLNAPDVPGYDKNPASEIPIFSRKEFKLFQDDQVHFNLQPVAMVVADTLEQANYAAALVKIKYEPTAHQTDIDQNLGEAVTPDKPSDYTRGDLNALKNASV